MILISQIGAVSLPKPFTESNQMDKEWGSVNWPGVLICSFKAQKGLTGDYTAIFGTVFRGCIVFHLLSFALCRLPTRLHSNHTS
jgi:hypothetical protein